jgi:hypothetical protein
MASRPNRRKRNLTQFAARALAKMTSEFFTSYQFSRRLLAPQLVPQLERVPCDLR